MSFHVIPKSPNSLKKKSLKDRTGEGSQKGIQKHKLFNDVNVHT